MKRKTIIYYHVGKVERGNGKPGYDWHEGYSTAPDGSSQPWQTYRECQREAKSEGAKAIFAKPADYERIGA